MKKALWIVATVAILLLVMILVSMFMRTGSSSEVSITVPTGFRGLVRVPIVSKSLFSSRKSVKCVISESGLATAIPGPTFSIVSVKDTNGRNILVVHGRPEIDQYSFYVTEYGTSDETYFILGDLSDYEEGWTKMKLLDK